MWGVCAQSTRETRHTPTHTHGKRIKMKLVGAGYTSTSPKLIMNSCYSNLLRAENPPDILHLAHPGNFSASKLIERKVFGKRFGMLSIKKMRDFAVFSADPNVEQHTVVHRMRIQTDGKSDSLYHSNNNRYTSVFPRSFHSFYLLSRFAS